MDTIRNDDGKEEHPEERREDRTPAPTTRWPIILVVLFLAAAVFGGVYAYKQSTAASNLTLQNQSLHSMIDQMRGQIDTLTAKLDRMAATPPAPTPPASAPVTKRTTSASSAAQDRRLKRVQSQLDEQQKVLKETQGQLAEAKSDLEGKLGSTREELNGSIAKTHDELVKLENEGERRFFEFDLSKSKNYHHEGPIQISIRKVDVKHQSYDLMMLVDDHPLAKKKVDLYEPIWLHQADQQQPAQIVVNKIEKDHVHGYVSVPRYTESQLSSNAAQPSTDAIANPVSDPSATSSSHSTSTPPSPSSNTSQGQQSPSQ